jgi:FtsP/CotA-like multicopper oxidase with cupredoxin domain
MAAPDVKGYVIATLTAAALLQALPALAQAPAPPTQGAPISCDPILGKPLVTVPEIAANKDGVLKGAILLSDENERIAFREPTGANHVPGMPGLHFTCYLQHVRTLRIDGAPPPPPGPDSYPNPLPGPTLRARVGDTVELTFLNQINVANFNYSIDVAENRPGGGCDISRGGSGYPGNPAAGGDAFPDCFHGSSTGNIHFHGSHVNPDGTGDNVFVEVQPSPRNPPGITGTPIVTAQSVQQQFEDFFKACQEHFKGNVLSQWPTSWNDAPLGPPTTPGTWTADQMKLLQQYAPQWASNDEMQWHSGRWPQFYIGAYPYCFHIPDYTDPTWAPSVVGRPPQTGLRMGQAPGTHWYHAHKHGSTAIDVANGMTGVFIMEGKYDDDLKTFYGADWLRGQKVLVINQLGVNPNLMRAGAQGPGPGSTDKGPDFSVNGRLQPVLEMAPGEVQMWRIANTAGRSGAYFIGPPKADETTPVFDPKTDFQWKQLAQDGVQFNDANYRKSLNRAFLLAAGNRADLLVKAPTTPGTYAVQVKHEVDPQDLPAAYRVTLLSVTVTSKPPVTGPQSQFIPQAPAFPPFLADIGDQEVTGTKTIVFASTPPINPPTKPAMHTIDGQKFGNQTGAVVLLNQVEEWRIENRSFGPPISHPFHIHVNPFQVVEVFDPNEALLTNPRTGFPVIDPNSGLAYPKYVLDRRQPLQTVAGHTQCYLDPFDPATWKPCEKGPQANRIWWDVFPIPSGLAATDAAGNPLIDPKTGQPVLIPGYFKMRSRFVDFAGYYVMHCHILAHEDRGMMTIVEVVPLTPPVQHH